MRARLRLRLAESGGFTLAEMLVVMAILGVVIGGLTQLFVAANNTTTDLTSRFRAQQEGRVALDGLRRELHCASAISPTTFPAGGVTSITLTLGSYCPSAPSGGGSVTWCTAGGGQRYALSRYVGTACSGAGVKKADYLTTNLVFKALTLQGGGLKARLSVDLPVDTNLSRAGGVYDLKDDIVLRNTSRT
jgi:prepilin-type N-terminal cleavage/methylation domain-containing protein